jgi:outer membrane PBP1 activator LpoA protein
MKPIRWLATLIISATLLTGCETTRMAPPAIELPASAAVAEKAERDGEYVLAAHEYTRLGQTAQVPQKQHFQLQAVTAFLKAGQIRDAHTLVETINVTRIDPSYLARKRILQARLASMEGAHEMAIRLLDEASRVHNLNPSTLSDIHSARAQAELALDNPIGAVRNLLVRQQYIVNKEDVAENQRQLWKILVSLPRARLSMEFNNARDPALSGWIELALIAVENAGNANRLTNAVEQWKKTHPTHAALESVVPTIATSSAPSITGRTDRIALLLPLTSGYAVAAQAVRDGFMAMDAVNADPDKPTIKIYDIGADPAKAPGFYDMAVNDGAQLVVGPLGREAAETIMRQANLKVPTLMLSHTDEEPGSAVKYLFQFGLPPEQEARQVAERAYLDGHRQAAVFYPKSPWGERMTMAFTDHWQRLGGVVVSSQPYNEEDNDYSDSIKHLLNITQSEERRNLLEKTLGQKLQFESRARQDIDFIFLATDAKHGRLLKPQLNFYHVAHIPVYSTSHIFTGKSDPMQDIDLDGIRFCDMPWILVGDGKIEQLRQTLQHDWPYAHSDLDRLYALGIDSYTILPNLNRISMESTARFSGVTSGLSLERDGRLHRQLLWARFHKGVPQLIENDAEPSAPPQPRP